MEVTTSVATILVLIFLLYLVFKKKKKYLFNISTFLINCIYYNFKVHNIF